MHIDRKNGDDEHDEQLGFPGGWRGIYRFVIIYGVAQIALLCLFTLFFNRP